MPRHPGAAQSRKLLLLSVPKGQGEKMVVTEPREGADVDEGCPPGDRLSRGTKAREGGEDASYLFS